MQFINNPHDTYFHSTMSNLKIAKDFFEAHLPIKFLKHIDLNTIKLEKTTFVDKSLKKLMSDILYSVNIEGENGYIYLLVEHQSSADKLMPFRLLEYTCKIMRQHIKANEKFLPVVIPLVLYNGKTKYPYKKDIFSLYGDETQMHLAKKSLCQPFHLLDLNDFSDEELQDENWSNIMMLLMKHIYSRDLIHVIESVKDRLKDLYYNEIGKDYVFSSMVYTLMAGDINDPGDFSDILGKINTNIGEEVMTLAERLVNQGMNEGLQKGLQKGYSKGLQQAAKNLLLEGVDPKIVAKATGLSIKEVENLTLATD